jgi:hypothetical protein
MLKKILTWTITIVALLAATFMSNAGRRLVNLLLK